MMLEEHIVEEQKHLGYICFTKFLKSYTEQREEFPLIEVIDNNTLMRQLIPSSHEQLPSAPLFIEPLCAFMLANPTLFLFHSKCGIMLTNQAVVGCLRPWSFLRSLSL
jgi:hypothetical protein